MDIDIVDVPRVAAGPEPRVNLGDVASGVGTAAGVTVWGSGDGFIGCPVAPDANGSARAIQLTQGNLRLALALRDPRWDSQAGNLAPGDRAIVSSCSARFKLTAADNALALLAEDAGVGVDGAGHAVNLFSGNNTLVVDASGARITVGSASISVTTAGIMLAFDGVASLTLSASGVSIVTTPPVPGALKVNGSVVA
jgi:hypothetical protein